MKQTLFLLVTLCLLGCAASAFAQSAPKEEGSEVGIINPADSSKDSSSVYAPGTSSYIPPAPGNINSTFMTANGYVWIDYLYWEYFATSLRYYDKKPHTSFVGTNDTADYGPMELAELDGSIGFLYDPTQHPENVQRRYNPETVVTVCFLISKKQWSWLPDFGVKSHKIPTTDVVDNGIGGSNYVFSPQEFDESRFKKDVDKGDLKEYLKKRAH